MTETVFEILAEGGSLIIKRKRIGNEYKFIYHHNEFDPINEELGINKNSEYSTFEQPFQIINSKYPWFKLHLETVHEDYRIFVIEELIKSLMFQGITPDELSYSQRRLEEALDIKLKFGNAPIKSGLQNIKVTNLMKLTEYDYHEYPEESGKEARLRGKYEIWTDEQIYSSQYNEIIREEYGFETKGKLEVSGNTIIIKNEFGQIVYAFSSDKFFVSTTPILSKSRGWYYINR